MAYGPAAVVTVRDAAILRGQQVIRGRQERRSSGGNACARGQEALLAAPQGQARDGS